MRCLACNCALSDREATRKYAGTTQFIDLCDHCFDPDDITDYEDGFMGGDDGSEEIEDESDM